MAVSFRAALLVALSAVAGCVASTRMLYDPQSLRDRVRSRAPRLSPDEVVVPFEIPEAQAARARRIVEHGFDERQRVRLLVEAMFDPTLFGLRYSARGATDSAVETLQRRQGNCLDLASVFIGLSRAAGLRSHYMDASRRIRETRAVGDGLVVNAGHITAVVETDAGNVTLDFSSEGEIVSYRVISDVEALANFYNNRGFERIEAAEDAGAAPDWAAASRDFARAVQVFPDFARAWNNLGIAAARMGKHDEAISQYRAAIGRDPSFAAPHNNLGLLYFARGELREAIRELEKAAALAPTAYNTYYQLAIAMLQVGDADAARASLERAIRIRGDYPEAESLLRSLR